MIASRRYSGYATKSWNRARRDKAMPATLQTFTAAPCAFHAADAELAKAVMAPATQTSVVEQGTAMSAP